MNNILTYLDELYPNPQCELNYNHDYELLIAVMLSAQTTDKRVNQVTSILFKKYPNLKVLKKANTKDIETLVKSLGNYKKKSLAIVQIAKILDENYQAKVPCQRSILESLPMVGRKTTNVVLSVLFNEPNIAVDTHVSRVAKRLKLVKSKDNVLIIEKKLKKKIPKDRWSKFHHQMVLFGRYQCKAIKPVCSSCKINNECLYYQKKEN